MGLAVTIANNPAALRACKMSVMEKECRFDGNAKIASVQDRCKEMLSLCVAPTFSTSLHTHPGLGILDGGWAPPYRSHGC